MYNSFFKFYKIFIKKGHILFIWDLVFQIFIILKLLFFFKKNNNFLYLIFQNNKVILDKRSSFIFLNINFFFYLFFENIRPSLVFISKIVSGKSQHIPYLALFGKDYTLSFQWFKKILREYTSPNLQYFYEFFFVEFLLILQTKGKIFSLREEFYSNVLKNRNFLKFLK